MQDSAYDMIYELEANHWWYRVKRRIVLRILKTWAHGRTNLSVLDIGCGTGQLMQELQQFGTIDGIDISVRAVAYCKERGLSPVVASASALPFEDNSFDAIVMLDVLEHLEDDNNGAKELVRVLSPKGLVIVTVPAYMFLWGGTDVAVHHFRRYTKKQLIEVLENAGLEINRASYYNTFLFPPIAVFRGLVRFFKIPVESEHTLGGPIGNKILHSIFSLESKLFPYLNFPFGVSILVVASKK